MRPLIKVIVWGLVLSLVSAIAICKADAGSDNYSLRPLSSKEKQKGITLIPYTTDIDGFKGSILKWIDENRIYERYGRRQLLQENRGNVRIKVTLHGVDYDREDIRIDIIPRQKRPTRSYGGYETGIECFEGAWPLYKALKDAGYEVKLAAAPVSYYMRHVYPKVKVGDAWVRVSTTPDVENFDFEINGPEEELSEIDAERNFESNAAEIYFDTHGPVPMALFTSSEGERFSIAAHVRHDPSKPFPVTVGIYGYRLGGRREIYKFSMGIESAHISTFKEWADSETQRPDRTVLQAIFEKKAQGELGFVDLSAPYAGNDKSLEELEETCGRILYDIVTNLKLEIIPRDAATSFTQAETIAAPFAGSLSMERGAGLAVSSI